jgi:hypothetical protein
VKRLERNQERTPVEQEILERIVRIETKIDGYNNLREKLDCAYQMGISNKDNIGELKDNQKWLSRTVAGAVIVSVISILFALIQQGVN